MTADVGVWTCDTIEDVVVKDVSLFRQKDHGRASRESHILMIREYSLVTMTRVESGSVEKGAVVPINNLHMRWHQMHTEYNQGYCTVPNMIHF